MNSKKEKIRVEFVPGVGWAVRLVNQMGVVSVGGFHPSETMAIDAARRDFPNHDIEVFK